MMMINLAADTPALLRAQDVMNGDHYDAAVNRARQSFAEYSNLSLVQTLLDRRDDIDTAFDTLDNARTSPAQRMLLLQRLSERLAAQDVCVGILGGNGVTEIPEWLTK